MLYIVAQFATRTNPSYLDRSAHLEKATLYLQDNIEYSDCWTENQCSVTVYPVNNATFDSKIQPYSNEDLNVCRCTDTALIVCGFDN